MYKKYKGPAIGIDLGTTYSCVAVWQEQHNRAEIIQNDQGNRTTPSFVAFTDKQKLIGDAAKNQAASNPSNTVFDAKRLIGRKYSDPIIQKYLKVWPFKVVAGIGDKPMILVNYLGEKKCFTAEEISSMVLTKMREIAEGYLKAEVKNAVITVPAYFNDSQRKATKDAGTIAGLNVLGTIYEPSAAALAYDLQRRAYSVRKVYFFETHNVFIFDLGGSTFDVSFLTISDDCIAVKATSGDNPIGGENFNNRMVNHFVKEFKRKYNLDISRNPVALRRLRTACERAKQILSFKTEATIDIDAIYHGIDFCSSLTQAKFEKLNMDLFEKCIKTVQSFFVEAKIDKTSVDVVILVGGSSRIPKVQQLLQEFFNGIDLCLSIHPDEAVAFGAAVQAALLTQGIRNIPYRALQEEETLSLGILTEEDLESTSIPINETKGGYQTHQDKQSSLSIKVYWGESKKESENNMMVLFNLKVPVAPCGLPIKVCFTVDSNGISKVSAEEETTWNMKDVAISKENGRLSSEEIERLIQDAEKFMAEDKKFKNKVRAVSALDDYLCNMKKVMKDDSISSMVTPLDKMKIKAAMIKGKKLVDGNLHEETFVFVDFLRELESIFESALNKINKGYSDEESD